MIRTTCLALAVLALGLAACDDPSNVGLGLVGEEGQPEVLLFEPTTFRSEPLRDVTGTATRVLAGRVDDPALGTITATAYVDFTSRFDTVANPAIVGAALQFRRDYVYGDTTTAVTFDVFDLTEAWTANGARADTTLPTGALVATVMAAPTDSLVDVPLPEAWLAANAETLASPDFAELFHGFAIEAAGGNAVLGFAAAGTALRIFTATDTTDYPTTLTLTGLTRAGTPALPAERLLVQDGLGPGVAFDFDFDEAALANSALNGGFVRLAADTTALATPPGFVRPLLETIQLVAVEEDSSFFLLGQAELDENGLYVFEAPPVVGAFSFRAVVQRLFFGERLYDHFELRFPTSNNTLDAVLLYDAGSGERAPRALLTIAPADG